MFFACERSDPNIYYPLEGLNIYCLKLVRYRDQNLVTILSSFFAGFSDDNEPSCFDEARGIKQ